MIAKQHRRSLRRCTDYPENWAKTWGLRSNGVAAWESSALLDRTSPTSSIDAYIRRSVTALSDSMGDLHGFDKVWVDWAGQVFSDEPDYHEGNTTVVESLDDLWRFLNNLNVGGEAAIAYLSVTLGTFVRSSSQTLFYVPGSAEYDITVDLDVLADGEPLIAVTTYTTHLDVWLPDTVSSSGELRENVECADLNQPCINAFLNRWQDSLGMEVKADKSVIGGRYVHNDGIYFR